MPLVLFSPRRGKRGRVENWHRNPNGNHLRTAIMMNLSHPVLLGLALAGLSLMTSTALANKPNVLFIVCDDLNTHVSTSGYPHISTPAFDELAAAGMTFRRAYCQYLVCGPSRASMPQRFKESGYWTGAVGKVFHNEKIDPGEVAWNQMLRFENDEMPMVTPIRETFEAEHGSVEQGKSRKLWREFYPTIAPQTRGQQPGYGPTGLTDEQHKDGKNARQIASWLKGKVHGDKPFLMACGIQKPHVPFLAPDKYFDMYPKSVFLLIRSM